MARRRGSPGAAAQTATRSTSRSPATTTSATSAARARVAGGAAATVTTIGRAIGEVQNGASQSSRQDRVTTATGTRDGP